MIARSVPLATASFLCALLAAGAGCAPAELRVPPPDGPTRPADGSEAGPTDGGAAPEARPLKCFPKPSPSGPDQPGDFCTSPDQCQHDADQIVTCAPRDRMEAQAKIGRCHRFTRSRLGESCVMTLTRGGQPEGPSALGDQTVPDEAGYCDVREGLICERNLLFCQALPTLGEDCSTRAYCSSRLHCEDGVCAEGKALGQSCQSTLDFTDQTECAAGARCDIGTSTCVPAALDGDKCDYGPACSSGVCVDGTCAPAGTCPP